MASALARRERVRPMAQSLYLQPAFAMLDADRLKVLQKQVAVSVRQFLLDERHIRLVDVILSFCNQRMLTVSKIFSEDC